MSDWVKNTSQEMPCEFGVAVEVEFRDGDTSSGFVEDFYWGIDGDIADIVMWRLKCSKTETPEEALDMIDTTSKQVEGLANDSELPNSSDWSNGDECIYMSHNVVHQFIGPCPKREGYGYIQAPDFEVNFVELSKLSKPESQEQKAERERLEAAYDLYCDWCFANEYPKFSFDRFKSSKDLDGMLVIVDKTGYRKAK